MLRTFCLSAVAACLLVAAPAYADSPFDGTWKADLSSATVDAKPNTFTISKGVYSCGSCLPGAYSVPAEGAFHPVLDRPYWDEVAVATPDARTVTYQFRKGGKVVARVAQVVSDDGKSLSIKSHNINNGAGAPVDTDATLTRVGPAPVGAHAVSGQWKAAPAASASDAALTFAMTIDGDRLHFASPGMGEALDTTFGGPYSLNAGDPGKTMTKAERLSPTAIRLTDMQGGTVTQVSTYTVSADGTTMISEWTDPRDGSKGAVVARRQP